ncbi:MAG: hypothetical protein ACRC8P_02845 [Spiroplasma sp.]
MNIIVIIILTVILVLTFSLITFLLVLFQKHQKSVFNNFAKDLNRTYKTLQLKKIDAKQLPVKVDEIEESIYFFIKAVIGKYDNPERVINDKNTDITILLRNSKLKIFYHYKIINLSSSKFLPLNKIDLLVTKKNIYLYHYLEPETIVIRKINNITIFWEKNTLLQRKDFFPGIGFIYEQQNYFLLFQTYNELLKFLACLSLVW